MTVSREVYYNSPLGGLKITMSDGLVTGLSFLKEADTIQTSANERCAVIDQLDEYFSGKRQKFSVPILLDGTSFEVAVWNVLLKIPYGNTVTYSDVGILLGDKNYARAVGNACNRNKIAMIIPCHRVVPKNSVTMGKYAYGSGVKRSLIEFEKSNL